MTDCAPADINYNLCVVLTERIADQQERLDLIWWGSWAVVGLMFVLLVAGAWFSSWRMLR